MTMGARAAGLLGVVFAGGESRRFGAPKALALYRGKALWSWGAEAVGSVSGDIVALVNDPEVASEVTVPTRADSGGGPLAGLVAGLAWAETDGYDGLAAVACDMPWLSPEHFSRLLEHWDGTRIVVPASQGPWGFEPLCGLYPVVRSEREGAHGDQGGRLLQRARGALEVGDDSLGAFVAREDPVVVQVPGLPKALRSVNSPEDLRPFILSIVGNKNSGKTRTVVALMRELSQRGHVVMSAKHGHHFEFDRKGSDSWCHRHEGGAERVLAVSEDEVTVMGSRPLGDSRELSDLVLRYLGDADVVVAEGFRSAPVPRVEVFRPSVQAEPVYGPDQEAKGQLLAAVVEGGGKGEGWTVPVFDASDPGAWSGLADLVESNL